MADATELVVQALWATLHVCVCVGPNVDSLQKQQVFSTDPLHPQTRLRFQTFQRKQLLSVVYSYIIKMYFLLNLNTNLSFCTTITTEIYFPYQCNFQVNEGFSSFHCSWTSVFKSPSFVKDYKNSKLLQFIYVPIKTLKCIHF